MKAALCLCIAWSFAGGWLGACDLAASKNDDSPVADEQQAKDADEDGDDDDHDDDHDDVNDSTEQLPPDVFPCDALSFWPYSLRSTVHPVRVHYRTQQEQTVAETLVTLLEETWVTQVDEMAFPPPYTDEFGNGEFACGTDEAIDVFVLEGIEEAYVDVVAEVTDTPADDYAAYMVIDPTGDLGGEALRPTVAHEFHHVLQAALDWSEAPIAYESSATFIEARLADVDDDWEYTLFDVADHPDWSIDRDAGYDTFFNYGQAAYFIFLQEAYFPADEQLSFFRDMWVALKANSRRNPTYQDALDDILAPAGLTFLDTVAVYARWWAFVGDEDDGEHFARGYYWPAPPRELFDVDEERTITIRPMVLGSAYVQLTSDIDEEVTLDLAESLPDDVRLVVQEIPGAQSDADLKVLPARVSSQALLVVTVLPAGAYDVLERSDRRIAVTLDVSR
jgi:hypothetical protein